LRGRGVQRQELPTDRAKEQALARKKNPILPPVGAAFAFPIGDGRFSVCRVLRDTTREYPEHCNTPSVLVACSTWIGDAVPNANDPSLRPILHPSHHSWKAEPELLWVSDEIPPDFIRLGDIMPTQEDQEMVCDSFGSWPGLTCQPLLQWRWDNERDAVLAEDNAKKTKEAESYLQAQREREKHLAQTSLADLRNHKFFARWKEYPPVKAIRASRKIMTDTVMQLQSLGKASSEEERLGVLQKCIESFNELDNRLHFIETIEREDICEEFEAIVHACGLGSREDLADEWRDW
jgi:hypothetical protein